MEIKPLSAASFANIFSHALGCLFVLFVVPFAVQKRLVVFFWGVVFFLGPHLRHMEVPRGQIGAVATDLHHSHSKARSKPSLRPKPQLTAMPDC